MLRVKLDYSKVTDYIETWINELKALEARGYIEIDDRFIVQNCNYKIMKEWIKEYCDKRIFINQDDLKRYGTGDDYCLDKCPKCKTKLLNNTSLYIDKIYLNDTDKPERDLIVHMYMEYCDKCNELYICNKIED